jgi:hypothetical protein
VTNIGPSACAAGAAASAAAATARQSESLRMASSFG